MPPTDRILDVGRAYAQHLKPRTVVVATQYLINFDAQLGISLGNAISPSVKRPLQHMESDPEKTPFPHQSPVSTHGSRTHSTGRGVFRPHLVCRLLLEKKNCGAQPRTSGSHRPGCFAEGRWFFTRA